MASWGGSWLLFVVFVRFGGLWFWFGFALGFSVVDFVFWAFCLVRFGCWFDCGVWGLWLACCLIRWYCPVDFLRFGLGGGFFGLQLVWVGCLFGLLVSWGGSWLLWCLFGLGALGSGLVLHWGVSVVGFVFWAFCLVRFGCWFDSGVWGLWLACCLIRWYCPVDFL